MKFKREGNTRFRLFLTLGLAVFLTLVSLLYGRFVVERERAS